MLARFARLRFDAPDDARVPAAAGRALCCAADVGDGGVGALSARLRRGGTSRAIRAGLAGLARHRPTLILVFAFRAGSARGLPRLRLVVAMVVPLLRQGVLQHVWQSLPGQGFCLCLLL